ncbi:hypothetical protein [Capnocytophaga canimorsus]|uniref:hypothetical protein n=2 Tax=Capnocytophaga canimorsus TaxID=28188 RepID=UPI000D6EABD4|nr:hypothetical protein [Capnocytophaga canimorsus]AWL78520.1 hypothetical protein DKB58_05940 [Capnocytophaga canimorsus]AYW37132.1 hypothetical protein D8L92_07385 [Capnocytophaga canimorsus]
MNKKLSIIFLLLWISMSHSQETISFSGYFREDFRTIRLDEKTANFLFIMEKGSVFLPERAYFLELLPADAERLQQKTALIIPLFKDDICYTYDTLFTIEATLVPSTENTFVAKKIYQNNKIIAQYPDDLNETFPSIYRLMQEGKPFSHRQLSVYEDLRDIPLWIDQLNNKDSIPFISEIIWHGVNKDGKMVAGSEYYQKKMAVADVAQQILDKLYRFKYDFPIPKNPTAQAYKIWLKNILNTDITEKICSSKIHTFRVGEEGYGTTLLKNNNARQRNIILLDYPRNGKQLIELDPVTFTEKNIPTEAISSIKSFYLNNEALYILKDFPDIVWQKYLQKGQEGNLSYKKQKENILMPKTKGNKLVEVRESLFTENVLYLCYKISNTYKALLINTKTGEKIKEINLSKLLPKDDAIDFIRVGRIGETQISYLPIIISGEKRKYQVNLTQNGASTLIDLGEKYTHWGIYFNGNPSYYLDSKGGTLYKYPISEEWEPEALFTDNFLDSVIAIADEKYVNVIYNTTDAFFEKVLLQRLDKQTLKKIGDPLCLYSYLVMENRSSENTPVNLWAFKAHGKWNVTFEIGDFLHWVQVQQ